MAPISTIFLPNRSRRPDLVSKKIFRAVVAVAVVVRRRRRRRRRHRRRRRRRHRRRGVGGMTEPLNLGADRLRYLLL